MSNEEKSLSRNSTRISAAVLAVEVILFSVFIIVVSVVDIDLTFGNIWFQSVMIFLGILLLTTGLMRKNNVALWLSIIFIGIGCVTILHDAWGFLYKNLYFIYFALPGLACLVTLFFSDAKRSHLKAMIFFIGLSLIFMFNSVWNLKWYYILAIAIFVIGSMLLINALMYKRGRWDDGDRPQRDMRRGE